MPSRYGRAALVRHRAAPPLKEPMARIGHSSTRAAMSDRHATRDRDRTMAAALDALIEENRAKVNGHLARRAATA